MGSRFSESLVLDVPGAAAEQIRTCGFRRNSSSLDKAPKRRDSVRLISFKSFWVTLLSISSKTWEMWFRAILESSLYCDWLFLVFSGIPLATAANFHLFLKVAMILKGKVLSAVQTDLKCYFFKKVMISSCYEGKVSMKTKQLKISTKKYQKASNFIIIKFRFFYLYLFLGGKHNCLHAKSR